MTPRPPAVLPRRLLRPFAGWCLAGCAPLAGLATRKSFDDAPVSGTTMPRAGAAKPDTSNADASIPVSVRLALLNVLGLLLLRP